MPCYSMSTMETVLENIKDISLLKAALEDMGFTVRLVNSSLAFSGVYKETGQWHSGQYDNGVLSSDKQLSIPLLKKHVGVANLKSNAKKFGWTLKPVKGDAFKFTVQK